MAKLNFTTKCPCGAKLQAQITKPNRFADSFAKVNCKICGSRIMLSCAIDKDEPGRVFTTHIDILELTPKAEEIMSKQFPIKAKMALEKAKSFVGIEEKPSIIQTDLDQTE